MSNPEVEPGEQEQKWCRYCKRLRPITDFRFQNKATGQRPMPPTLRSVGWFLFLVSQ